MSRRPSKHLRQARPLLAGHAQSDTKTDGVWVVRTVPGSNAVKTYRCPGCDHTITPGTPHIVAWPHTPPMGAVSAVEVRRHWHTSCWARRQ